MDKSLGAELRQTVAVVLASDPVKYNAALLGKRNEEYVQHMLSDKSWGGSIELAVLQSYYAVQINAIDVVSLQTHRFGEGKGHEQCVYVLYDGIHYDALLMSDKATAHRLGAKMAKAPRRTTRRWWATRSATASRTRACPRSTSSSSS